MVLKCRSSLHIIISLLLPIDKRDIMHQIFNFPQPQENQIKVKKFTRAHFYLCLPTQLLSSTQHSTIDVCVCAECSIGTHHTSCFITTKGIVFFSLAILHYTQPFLLLASKVRARLWPATHHLTICVHRHTPSRVCINIIRCGEIGLECHSSVRVAAATACEKSLPAD